MAANERVAICYREPRRVFWLRHYLNRLVPKLKRSGEIPIWPRLCAFPNDLIGREMSVAGLYEMAGISAVRNLCQSGTITMSESSTFIDVGANVGVYTTALSKIFGAVLAFEPHPITSRLLQLNIEINEVRNTKLFRCALSDRDGKARLNDVGVDNIGASTLDGARIPDSLRDGHAHEVEMRRGDDFLDGGDVVGKISFMKIDVEGHEKAVIDGMTGLILKHMPVIAFEANSGESSEIVRHQLKLLGYTNFLGLDFYPQIRSLPLRVFLLTILGVQYTLAPVKSLAEHSYSLVFALTENQWRSFNANC